MSRNWLETSLTFVVNTHRREQTTHRRQHAEENCAEENQKLCPQLHVFSRPINCEELSSRESANRQVYDERKVERWWDICGRGGSRPSFVWFCFGDVIIYIISWVAHLHSSQVFHASRMALDPRAVYWWVSSHALPFRLVWCIRFWVMQIYHTVQRKYRDIC